VGKWALVVAVPLGLFVSVTAASRLGNDPTAFNRQLEAALAKNDMDFLGSVAADDLQDNDLSGGAWNRTQWLDYMSKAQFASRTLVDDQVEVHGDVVIATARTNITYVDPKRRASQQVQQRVYQRRPDGWQLVSLRTLKAGPVPESPG
jgi:ketosteroid isomerase-like protein